MRAPRVLAAIALAGTVLLGGAGQALADDNDNMSNSGADFGNSSPADSDFNFGENSSDSGQNSSDVDQDETLFGRLGSVFERAGH